ncbi:MAG: hypothetical protein P8O07_04155 [Crocinitomicaceae bacterium]|nr:hypothetical protein [Crocinitomicaceae bacterium]
MRKRIDYYYSESRKLVADKATNFLLFITLFLVHLQGITQILNNKTGEAFTDRPFFNAQVIKQNKIQTISGKFTVKKVNDILRTTDLERKYYFDPEGRIIKTYETIQAEKGRDTIVTYWEYDELGNVSVIRTADQYGFYATHYSYDSLKRVVREEFRRNLNQNKSSIGFELGDEFVVSYETSRYETFPGQEKRIVYNSYDQPYKEEISYFDEDGFLIEKMDRLKRTSGIKKTNYFYNEKGLLDSLLITSNQTGSLSRLFTYEYDNFGNLMSQQYYKNGLHTTEFQVIYHRETTLLNYILTREISTNYITILSLDNYTFFNKGEVILMKE